MEEAAKKGLLNAKKKTKQVVTGDLAHWFEKTRNFSVKRPRLGPPSLCKIHSVFKNDDNYGPRRNVKNSWGLKLHYYFLVG